MRPRFLILDVFTDRRFGGNPLAVIPDARGLDRATMQRIAREFNFSETTFVLPAEATGDRRVRIFTPGSEVPFAGHPNIGTAAALALLGELGPLDAPATVRFEELAGIVPVTVARRTDGLMQAELIAPAPLTLGDPVDPRLIAAAIGLDASAIAVERHAPRSASVGLAFLVAELTSAEALAEACVVPEAMARLVAATGLPYLHLHTAGSDGLDRRTRMFAPFDGVPEDPATGSANAALAALLATTEPGEDLDLELTIAQGIEMGRPSRLQARVRKREDVVIETRIGGTSILIADGSLMLD
jgi:trans-2,3-dihydro-3-hydroxyanthranilate isomerase